MAAPFKFTWPNNTWTQTKPVGCLGIKPCGTKVYPDAPNESCAPFPVKSVGWGASCTPKPRWKRGGDSMTRIRLVRAFGNYVITDENPPVLPWGVRFEPDGELSDSPINGAQLMGREQCDAEVNITGPGILTPFRRAYNAGDPYMTVNRYPNKTLMINGAPAPVPNQVKTMARAANQSAYWGTLGGGPHKQTNGSAFTGNPKWVYDGSDYIKFKKLQANNRNFNDITYGGDRNNASQVPRARVRRGMAGI